MTAINPVTDLSQDGEIAVVTLNSPPVNALSAQVREGLFEAFSQANASDAKAIVLICEGRTFIAGADISEFGGAMTGPSLQDVQGQIESSPKPVVAAIHGTALGGGLEVALCAHYRVAVPSARLGLPEVALGLLPGAGGTQRLPRIVGVEKALEMVTSGQHVPAKAALAISLVDELVEEGKLREGALAFARKAVAEGKPLVKVRDNNAKLEAARGHPEIFANFRKANARKFRGFLAPENNIKAVEAAVNAASFEAGLNDERRLFMELMSGTQARAQQYFFFSERKAAKIDDIPDDTRPRDVRKVGMIGAGTMGGGIAMCFANAGIPVVLVDSAQEALDRGVQRIKGNYAATVAKGRLAQSDMDKRMGLIHPSVNLGSAADADIVVEAVFERMDVKEDMFRKLDAIVQQGAILATNTSTLDVDRIAAATTRPQEVIGTHFFSPANVMRLLEVVRGSKTAPDVLATTMKLGKTLKKVPVVSGVCDGFIGNRMLEKYGQQSLFLIEEGATPAQVDAALERWGMAMGPFTMYDMAGNDIGWEIRKRRAKERPDMVYSKFADRICEKGWFGQKTGRGWYRYEKGSRKPIRDPEVEEMLAQYRRDLNIPQRSVSDDEIVERCIFALVNEGARILEEGIALRASDIDMVYLTGYGFPPYRGGPMFYADSVGLGKVLTSIQSFQKGYQGSQWQPAPLLVKLAKEGKRFNS